MKLVTVSELAAAMGWSEAKARKLVEKRLVPVVRDPFDNRLKVDLDRLHELQRQAADQAHRVWQAQRGARNLSGETPGPSAAGKRRRGRPRKSDTA